jgi:sugar lactone lactonase YvrE
LVAALLALLASGGEVAAARAPLDIRTFARIGPPGQPEPIAVARDGTVYVGTNQQQRGHSGAPSRIFAFSPGGRLVRQYVVRGQELGSPHGIQGLAFDAGGLLYALDRAERPRIFTLDPRTGRQRDYATFRDVPSCTGAPNGNCSATNVDNAAGPDFAAFAPDGTLYVTDIDQALIWRVRKGGGRPTVFFTDPRLESVFGPNGIALMRDRRTLMFAVTGESPVGGSAAQGRVYKLPILPSGRPGALESFWQSRPLDGPDGFAIARSGKVYLALAGVSQLVVLSAAGEELARIPGPADQPDPPFDAPASVAFSGNRALVTNQSFPAGNPDHWVVFDVFTGEPGLPLFRPRIGTGTRPARLSLGLVYERGRDRAGRRCALGRIRAWVNGPVGRIRHVTFRFDGRRVERDERRPFAATVLRRRDAGAGRHRVVARVKLRSGKRVGLRRAVRTCG